MPLFVGLLLIGAGSAVSLQGRFAATDLAEPGHKARALALVVWVGMLGTVLGPNLGAPGAVVGAATGLTVFASAFLIASVCLALAGTVVFVLLRPDPLLTLARHLGTSARRRRRRRPDRWVRGSAPWSPRSVATGPPDLRCWRSSPHRS